MLSFNNTQAAPVHRGWALDRLFALSKTLQLEVKSENYLRTDNWLKAPQQGHTLPNFHSSTTRAELGEVQFSSIIPQVI